MNILTPTADGSNTFYNEEIGEHYHSAHGALQEAKHVFIKAGLMDYLEKTGDKAITIFEVGFGTGLNFLLTLDYCLQHKITLNYTAVEAFPLYIKDVEKTGYHNFVSNETWDVFIDNYEKSLTEGTQIHPLCELTIANCQLQDFITQQKFNVVYYDAFSVRHQPEMWSDEIIAHTCSTINSNGFFVTYAITGNLKRAVKTCGFTVQKLAGAPGKREMLRAVAPTKS